MSRGITNKNPFNLEKTKDKWQGLSKVQKDKRFFQFDEDVDGLRAGFRTLIIYQTHHKLNTLIGILHRFAPSKENDTQSYISSVSDVTGFAPNEALDLQDGETLRELGKSIILVENGIQPYSDSLLDRAILMAGGKPAVKPIHKSRTVIGAQVMGGTAGLSGLLNLLAEVAGGSWTLIEPYLPYLKGASIALVAVTVLAAALVAYSRYMERKSVGV